jgi:hypothetical protein
MNADDRNRDQARRAAQHGDSMANPNTPGTRAWFEWEEAYKEQHQADGQDYHDGAPPGCPAW